MDVVEDEAVAQDWFGPEPAVGTAGGSDGKGVVEVLPPPPPPQPLSSDEGGAPPPPPQPLDDDPGLWAEAAVPQEGSVHRVCTVGHLSWCSVCRWARPSTSRARWPAECDPAAVRAEFAGDANRVQLAHPVIFVRGLCLCLRCGAFSGKRLFKLAGPHCQATTVGKREPRRVFAGQRLTMVGQWPLEKLE